MSQTGWRTVARDGGVVARENSPVLVIRKIFRTVRRNLVELSAWHLPHRNQPSELTGFLVLSAVQQTGPSPELRAIPPATANRSGTADVYCLNLWGYPGTPSKFMPDRPMETPTYVPLRMAEVGAIATVEADATSQVMLSNWDFSEGH